MAQEMIVREASETQRRSEELEENQNPQKKPERNPSKKLAPSLARCLQTAQTLERKIEACISECRMNIPELKALRGLLLSMAERVEQASEFLEKAQKALLKS